jgi:CheY-like chemotaxis protein
MSHELRTPLNAIIGFSQLLELDELLPKQQRHVGLIVKAGRHLLELINEVLDVARIEAGRLQLSLEAVPVCTAIREALDLVRPLAARREVRLSLNDDGLTQEGTRQVRADPLRLQQVLLNLLSNAIKYNREGGQVTVRCVPTGDRLCIAVQDTGPGIAPEQLNRLFVPFERLGAEQTRVEGTGLGLALARHLVEAMDGQLDVQSTVGAGSIFTVTLPLAARPPAPVQAVGAAPVRQGQAGAFPRTVLCIEDNAPNLMLLQGILERRHDIRLLLAMQGRFGLDMARTQHPDLILLDLHLPDTNGAEVLRELRADPATRHVPVVVLSADATADQHAELLQAGARAYLTKPLDVVALLDLVDEILQVPGRTA